MRKTNTSTLKVYSPQMLLRHLTLNSEAFKRLKVALACVVKIKLFFFLWTDFIIV